MVHSCLPFFTPKAKAAERERPFLVYEQRPGSSHSNAHASMDVNTLFPTESCLQKLERQRTQSIPEGHQPTKRVSSISRLRKTRSAPIVAALPAVHQQWLGTRKEEGKRRVSEPTRPVQPIIEGDEEGDKSDSLRTLPEAHNISPNLDKLEPQEWISPARLSLLPPLTPPVPHSPAGTETESPSWPIPSDMPIVSEHTKTRLPQLPALNISSRISWYTPELTLQLPEEEEEAPSSSTAEDTTTTNVEKSDCSHRPQLSLQIIEKAGKEVKLALDVEDSPLPAGPMSQRSSKRVTFSESGAKVITSAGPNADRHISFRGRQSWSSVFLITAPSSPAHKSLSRNSSVQSLKSPAATKSILRRTSSYQGERIKNDDEAAGSYIAENPMMVKNLKRLPRSKSVKNLRKEDPLPVLPSLAEFPSTIQNVSKYTRHPMIARAPSPPSSSSSTESYYSRASSSASENESAFKTFTVSEPVHFTKLESEVKHAIPPSPPSSSASPANSRASSSSSDEDNKFQLINFSKLETRTRSLSASKTVTPQVAAGRANSPPRPSSSGQGEGKWLRRGSAFGVTATPPPVPPLPSGVMA